MIYCPVVSLTLYVPCSYCKGVLFSLCVFLTRQAVGLTIRFSGKMRHFRKKTTLNLNPSAQKMRGYEGIYLILEFRDV